MTLRAMHLITIILLLQPAGLFAQQQGKWVPASAEEFAKDTEAANSWFRSTPVYSVDVSHSSYQDHNTTVPFEKQRGNFSRNGKSYRSHLLGIRTFQTEKYRVVVDSAEKLILITNPDLRIWDPANTEAYTSQGANFKSIMKSEAGKEKAYLFDYGSHSSIGSVLIKLNAEGLFKSITIYYTNEKQKLDNREEITVKPRLEIAFSNYRKNPPVRQEDYDGSGIVAVSNNKVTAQPAYKGFQLLDQRLPR